LHKTREIPLFLNDSLQGEPATFMASAAYHNKGWGIPNRVREIRPFERGRRMMALW
jgi:hypothetical protein